MNGFKVYLTPDGSDVIVDADHPDIHKTGENRRTRWGHSPTKSSPGVIRIKRIVQARATHSGSEIYHDEHFL